MYLFFGFVGLIMFVVIKGIFKSVSKGKSNVTSGNNYTPTSDIYSGRSRDYDAAPVEQRTRSAEYESQEEKQWNNISNEFQQLEKNRKQDRES
ncbi:hypothetical protein [Halobacillus sp. BBL2006]|uniref:hypothetical protein n=1 Tax=Halobacillus sp. BBL2006 TaxID=1543706 RepID=UPI000AB14E80|nr:hypothetical protein [Halobacillus sp. BBL2006]